MAEQQIVMKVPEEIVRAHVQAAVVQALSKDPEALVRAVVQAAMQEKKNSYDRETIWDARVNKLIRDVAVESLQEWLEEMRPQIRAQVREVLGKRHKEQVAKMAERLLGALEKTSFHVSISDRE